MPICDLAPTMSNVPEDVVGERSRFPRNGLGMTLLERGHQRVALPIPGTEQAQTLANNLALIGITTFASLLGDELGKVVRQVHVHRPHSGIIPALATFAKPL
jgi:hypothetical protein